jgi:hypothetical protein
VGATSQGAYATAVGAYAALTSQGSEAVAIGNAAGQTSQGDKSVAIGKDAGLNVQGATSVAVGFEAGCADQGDDSVAIGNKACKTSQGDKSVAIGANAGLNVQGATSVAVGFEAGCADQGADSVAIGNKAGQNAQGANSVAIGAHAGSADQADESVAIGYLAGSDSQGSRGIAVGYVAGKNAQGYTATAVGVAAGANSQGTAAVAVGLDAGENVQGDHSVAIGNTAGASDQQSEAIAIGYFAGSHNQKQFSIAIGYEAQRYRAESTAGTALAIGYLAGSSGQQTACTAIGQQAGQNSQRYYAQAFGFLCGNSAQGHAAVAIGQSSGVNSQGVKAVAIGVGAGENGQSGSSICITAGNCGIDANIGVNRFYVSPVRSDNSGSVLRWNSTTKEICRESSDDRLKDDEKLIRNALNTIMKLKPQVYEKRGELDPQSQTDRIESGHMAQDVYYDTPELRHLVYVPDTANPTPEKPPAPSDDPRDDPDYSAWGGTPADVDTGGMVAWLVRGVQEIVKELPRSKTTVSNTWGQNITSLVVSANTNKHKTNTIPLVTLSNVHNDKSWYGVVSNETVDDTDDYDTLIDIKGDTKIWVVDTNGSLESGDLLTTSNTSPGYAVKQDDDFIRSHTVAKMTQDCDFTEPIQRPVMRKRQQLTDVTYYLNKRELSTNYTTYKNIGRPDRRSITSKIVYRKSDTNSANRIFRDTTKNIEVDETEYETLPESQRSIEHVHEIDEEGYNTMTDEAKVGYTRVEKTVYNRILVLESRIQKTSHPIEEIRQELTDVLDENGQIIWEETGETEPVYTLVNHGTHKAALVTCKLI